MANRHGWYLADRVDQERFEANALVHADHTTGARTVRRLPPGDTTSEPVFVPRGSGDGWILAVVHRAAENRSELVVLEALDLAGPPVAVLELPRRVPDGFHGTWVDARWRPDLQRAIVTGR